ncbi:MAG TPA: protein kinase, partial [Ktedonobacteraceae bacterium]|nr:protein kinase [Ktedonobacteraceae bacterium]
MASEVFCFHCGAAHAETSGFCHSCGQALLLGKRYHVLEQLGSGGFGEVYQAEDVQAGSRPVALKRLLLSTILPHEQLKAIEAFRHEGQMIAQLKHPGLPELYDQFDEQGTYYLVLEFLPGETLERLLERQGTRLLPVSMVVQFGIELASVLSYLHTRQPPVVFRDLKPANVMVAPDSQVRLIDFGIARRFLRDEKKHTENLGTPGYASPEHYSLVTPLSDIYSLGAMLHELLSGEQPGSHGLFLYPELHLQGAPEKRLATLVSRMVKRNAHRRPRNALQVKRELQAILEALSLPGPLPPLSLPLVKSGPPVPKQLPSVAPVQPKPGDLSYTYPYSSQSIRALAWSPDGQYLAALGEDPSQLLVWSTHSHQLILTQRVFRE